MADTKIIPRSKAQLVVILDSCIKMLRGNRGAGVFLELAESLKEQAAEFSDEHDMTPMAPLFSGLFEWGPMSFVASMDAAGMHSITTIGQFAGAEIKRIAPNATHRTDIGGIWFVSADDLTKIADAAANWTPTKFVPDLKSKLVIDGVPA